MYDVNDYGRMMADPGRMNAYTEALRRSVKPGDVVVDVGTGTGVFALLAAKFGARKVYAIDTNPCVLLGREVARRNGFADRIEFLQKSVFDVKLPEPADVLVADCRGAFTLFDRNLDMMVHARGFLRPGGTVIPLRDELFVSVVEWPSFVETLDAGWTAGGFDWSVCRDEGHSIRIVAPDKALEGARFLVEATRWAVVDFTTLSSTSSVRGKVDVRASAAGRAHFLALWFRGIVADGLEVTSAPTTDPRRVYSPLLLPVDPPLELAAGETVSLGIDALHAADGYVFAWRIRAQAGERRQISEANLARLLPAT